MSEGLDTALARRLDALGRLPTETLVAALERVREQRQRGDLSLAVHLVGQGLLQPEEAEAHLQAIQRPLAETSAAALALPEYERLRELGRGGMGVVYEVRHVETGQRYALKEILDLDSPGSLDRFRREAQILASLRHTNLVQVHTADFSGPRPTFVQDLLTGGTLRDRLRGGPLAQEEALRVFGEVCDAIGFLHERGVLHRDLKPENVLFDEEGRAHVADFGLARQAGALTLTQTGEILGTPAYMAPEQALDSRRVDERSDVYALGAILYATLTGAPPFQGRGVLATLDAVVNEQPPSPRTLNSAIPLALEAVCLRALAKSPEDRPSSPSELVAEVRAAAGGGASQIPARVVSLVLLALLAVVARGVGISRGLTVSQAKETPSETAPAQPASTTNPVGPGATKDPGAEGASLELDASGPAWLERSKSPGDFGAYLEARRLDPGFQRLERDAEFLTLLYGKDLPPPPDSPSREQRALLWARGHSNKVARSAWLAQGQPGRRVGRLVFFASLLSGDRSVLIKRSEMARLHAADGDENRYLRAAAATGLPKARRVIAKVDPNASCGQADWDWLRQENREAWSKRPEPKVVAWLPEPFNTRTRRARALRVLGLARGANAVYRRVLEGAIGELGGAWPKSIDEVPARVSEPGVVRRREDQIEEVEREGVSVTSEVNDRLLAMKVVSILGGGRTLVSAGTSLKSSINRLAADPGSPEEEAVLWSVVIALIGLDTPRPGNNLDRAWHRLATLGNHLEWAEFYRAATAARYLASVSPGVSARNASFYARGADPKSVPNPLVEKPKLEPITSVREAIEVVAPLLATAREIEQGKRPLGELRRLRQPR